MQTCLVRLIPVGLAKGGASSVIAHLVGGTLAAVDLTLLPLGVVAGSVVALDHCSKECGLDSGTMTPFNITAP